MIPLLLDGATEQNLARGWLEKAPDPALSEDTEPEDEMGRAAEPRIKYG